MENGERLYENIPEEIKKSLEGVTGMQDFPPKNPKLIDYKASLSVEQFLWLFLYGEQKDWRYYSNMGSMTKIRSVDDLLEELYASFENAEYRSDKDGLDKHQAGLYDYIVSRLLDDTESVISRNEGRALGVLNS